MKDVNAATKQLLWLVYGIYFFNGMAMCFEGTFNPEIKELFDLDYTRLMYMMLAKSIPFLLFSVLVGIMAQKHGLKNTLSMAMIIAAFGAAGIAAGIQIRSYPLILGACFVIGIAFTVQLVSGNPLLSILGAPEKSSVRLNFANALGAIAQMIGMFIVYLILPATIITAIDKIPYILSILYPIAFLLLALGILARWMKWEGDSTSQTNNKDEASRDNASPATSVWREPKIVWGFIILFVVLGVEAGIFGLFRNFAEEPSIGRMDTSSSILYYTFYFILFAAGRFLGAALQQRIRPVKYLLASAIAALCFIVLAISTKGMTAVISLIAVGFFASVFFPTIYSIAIEGMGSRTAKASGVLTMGMIGGAILPVLQGKIADLTGLQYSFTITATAYIGVLFFALLFYKKQN